MLLYAVMVKSKTKLLKPSTNRNQALEILSSKVSYDGPVFKVTTDHIREPNGVTTTRDLIRHSGSIVILPLDDSGAELRVLLVRQYRYAAKSLLWEVPAGRIEPGEDQLQSAKRELREETGFTARHWKPVLRFFVSPGFLDEVMNVYLATDLAPGKAEPEEDEKITARFFPLSKALRMCLTGKIADAKTMTSIFWLFFAQEKKQLAGD